MTILKRIQARVNDPILLQAANTNEAAKYVVGLFKAE